MLRGSPNSPFARPSTPVGALAADVAANVQTSASGQRAAASVASTLDVTIQRLEEVIEQETTTLRSGVSVNIEAFNVRKSQALLELTRLLRQVQGGPPNEQLVKRVESLQAKLAVNRAVLKMHLEAVREISSTLADAIREADSDGTYTPSTYAAGRRQ
ncbi:MAG: hypothetical protein WC807_07680 [Hyphomicrobium sp.]|jgi:hypothetical protein